MDEQIPSYVYSPIEPDDFRVLKILEVHPQIKFSLEAFSIYEAPGYEALSYAWGTSPEMEESLCNGARFRISQTLGQALRGIHAHSGGGWIWVDAICINQTDAEEKAHQVAGMGELYSCADQVLIWLGDAADQSDLACALLPELTEKIWSLKDSEGGWRPLSTDDIVAQGLPHPDDPLWCAALLLYSRAWFQRLWIVQEVVLARACVFLCGLQQIEWHVVVNFAIATSKSFFVSNIAGLHIKAMGEDRVSRSTNGIRLIRNSRRLKDSLEDDEKEITGLQATMDIMQSQGASVKVDYVYAVRDMLPDALRDQMVVDYSDEIKRNYGIIHARLFRQCLERLSDWPSLRFPPNAGQKNIPSLVSPLGQWLELQLSAHHRLSRWEASCNLPLVILR